MALFTGNIEFQVYNEIRHESNHYEPRDRNVSGRVTQTQREALEAIAHESGQSLSDIVDEAITLYMAYYPNCDQLVKHHSAITKIIQKGAL
jgi:hypothetical protein